MATMPPPSPSPIAPKPAPEHGLPALKTLAPEEACDARWMDGVERFFSSVDADLVAGLAEIRVVRDREIPSRSQVVLVLRMISPRSTEQLASAARQAFPGWIVRIAVQIDPLSPSPGLAG
jgi:hypothetical protein